MPSVSSALSPTFKPSSFSFSCTLQHSVTKSKLKLSFTARLSHPLCPTVAPQELGMATSLLEALQQQRVTKHPGILFFLIQRSKRRLAGRKDVKFIQKLGNCSKKGVILLL